MMTTRQTTICALRLAVVALQEALAKRPKPQTPDAAAVEDVYGQLMRWHLTRLQGYVREERLERERAAAKGWCLTWRSRLGSIR